jgi:hypothetical protein
LLNFKFNFTLPFLNLLWVNKGHRKQVNEIFKIVISGEFMKQCTNIKNQKALGLEGELRDLIESF